jgi:hypothetical protein
MRRHCPRSSCSRVASCALKRSLSTTTFASGLSARLNGSRLLEPTVLQLSSTIAILPRNGRAQYSWTSTPACSRWRYNNMAAKRTDFMSGTPCKTSVTATPRRAALQRSRNSR